MPNQTPTEGESVNVSPVNLYEAKNFSKNKNPHVASDNVNVPLDSIPVFVPAAVFSH